MKPGDIVRIGDLSKGDWFWYTDGDLHVIVEQDSDGVDTRYWNSRFGDVSYSKSLWDPDKEEFPDPGTGSGLWFQSSELDYQVEVIKLAIEPVTDEEMAATLASIKAAMR